jgi:signal transduction histidine kinase
LREDETATSFARLDEVRAAPAATVRIGGYTTITAALLNLDSTIVQAVTDTSLARSLRAAHSLTVSHEYLAQQQVLVDAALSGQASDGSLPAVLRAAGVLSAEWRAQFDSSAPPDVRSAYSAALPPGAAHARDDLVTQVLGTDGQLHTDVTIARWREVGQPVVTKTGDVIVGLDDSALATATANAGESSSVVRYLTIVLAMVAAGAVVVIVVVLRALRSSLKTLRNSAADIAGRRLPGVLRDVRDGLVDGAEPPRLPVIAGSELNGLGEAFATVCGEAVNSAAEQALIRSGYSEVFSTVFHRAGSLLEQQLVLIEELERTEESPEQLAALYQLDHLITRTRRNEENALVLSGSELDRRAAEPVPLTGVVQGAISEIEHYQRVDIVDPPVAKIVDTAANDLIRVLAELLDNATSFSAPETRVTVQGQVMRDGSLSVAIADDGAGMTDGEMLAANERLNRLGSAEFAKSRRVGLLVVGRLAGRHGIGVELLAGDRSVGVMAIVTVPAELVVEAERPGWADRRIAMEASSANHQPAGKGASAGGRKPRRLVAVEAPRGRAKPMQRRPDGRSSSRSGSRRTSYQLGSRTA